MSVGLLPAIHAEMLTLLVWLRPNFYASPSISQSINAGLAVSGLTRDDIDLYDFYSCFPIVPKLAAGHLGLSLEGYSDTRPVTIIGGLTSFGGAGNNYSMHVSSSSGPFEDHDLMQEPGYH